MHRRSKRARAAAAAVVTLAAMVGTVASPIAQRAIAAAPSADVVVLWNANAVGALIGVAGQGPTVAILHLAMVQGAVYDAVNGIDGGHQPYLGVPAAADPGDSMEAAAATAAHDVLVGLFSTPPMTNPAVVTTLDSQLAATLSGIPDGAAKTGGMLVGAQAASLMLATRTGDGRFPAFVAPAEGFGPGEWRRTTVTATFPFGFELAPWVGDVDPFVIDDPVALRSVGPNALTSDAYTEDFREVKRYGSATSTVRTADQTHAALFWQANGAGLWNFAFRQLADTQDLDIVEAARLFAMGDLAGADGAIVCWNDKYARNFWRPQTAIRDAELDGNPATHEDDGWTPLIATPPFPEHPSGHSCVSGAIARTLQRYFGTDEVSFSSTGTFLGVTRTRSFHRFSVAIREILDARVWGGIHFRTADTQGRVIGNKVAHALIRNYFGPVV